MLMDIDISNGELFKLRLETILLKDHWQMILVAVLLYSFVGKQ